MAVILIFSLYRIQPTVEMRRSKFFDKAYFLRKYIKQPKTIVKPHLPKVGHGIMVLDPTFSDTNFLLPPFKTLNGHKLMPSASVEQTIGSVGEPPPPPIIAFPDQLRAAAIDVTR